MVQTEVETEIIIFFTGAIWELSFTFSLSSPVRGLNSSRSGAMQGWSDPADHVTHRAAKCRVAPAPSRFRPRTDSEFFRNSSLCTATRSLAHRGEASGERHGEVG
jgi:hypothetical protein